MVGAPFRPRLWEGVSIRPKDHTADIPASVAGLPVSSISTCLWNEQARRILAGLVKTSVPVGRTTSPLYARPRICADDALLARTPQVLRLSVLCRILYYGNPFDMPKIRLRLCSLFEQIVLVVGVRARP